MHSNHTVSGNSRTVISTQTGPHEQLLAQVAKHSRSDWGKPITDYNQAAFDRAQEWLLERTGKLILDSGCGTGDSSRALAEMFPAHQIIGVDRSAHRLSRQRQHTPDNCLLVRADLLD
ncbi:MAG: SAM-dependent methyltransferase, partial [Halothiobacillus sp. 13-55-115]